MLVKGQPSLAVVRSDDTLTQEILLQCKFKLASTRTDAPQNGESQLFLRDGA